MEIIEKIVEFENYCKKCKYENLSSVKDPCNECLDHPCNQNSKIPVCFEEKEEDEK